MDENGKPGENKAGGIFKSVRTFLLGGLTVGVLAAVVYLIKKNGGSTTPADIVEGTAE